MAASKSPDDPRSAVLLAVGGLLNREIAIDDLLARMVDHIQTTMAADRGTVYLLDRGTGELFSKAAHLPELEEIRLQLGQGVAGHVASTGEVVNAPTVTDDARFYGGVDELTGYKTESILAVPLRDHRGDILGVLQLLNKQSEPFSSDDTTELVRMSQQVAWAIEATTLYQDLARAPASQLKPLPIAAQFNRIIGESEQHREACLLTARAASTDATVLVRGESGTGKELFARAIHVNSPRSEGPFVKVDCAALPESLIDNELFGHEQGAYTGADQKALGKLDAAAGGTLFLDEIGELPLAVQGKLLRLLQDRDYLRVGGTEPVQSDARVVAATNRDLESLRRSGRFRTDLYFRIKVVQIELPPLRARGDKDIIRLANHFATEAAKRHGRPVRHLSRRAIERLCAHRWPGNVRELENCIESAVVITSGNAIDHDDLPLLDRSLDDDSVGTQARAPLPAEGMPADETMSLAAVERRHILHVLNHADGNQTVAAKLLGIGRNTLARKLKKYDL